MSIERDHRYGPAGKAVGRKNCWQSYLSGAGTLVLEKVVPYGSYAPIATVLHLCMKRAIITALAALAVLCVSHPAQSVRRLPSETASPPLWVSGSDYYKVDFYHWGASFHRRERNGKLHPFPFGTFAQNPDGTIEGEIYWEVKTPDGWVEVIVPLAGARERNRFWFTYDHPAWDGSRIQYTAKTLRLHEQD